jgi:hypothetical protein
MPMENAVAVAAPPGTSLPTVFPLSCAQPTTNQLCSCNATRLSCHSQTKLPASASSASAVQYQVSPLSDRHDEKTATRLGSSMYSETAPTRTSYAGRA